LPPVHTLGRRNGMHIPSSRPAQAGVRPTLKSTLQRSAPHPARGRCNHEPILSGALPSGDVFAAAGEPKQMHSLPVLSLPSWCARAEQVPANPVRAARLRPALCAHSVRRLPGAPAGRTSTGLGAGSPPPLSAEGTLQAKAAACGLPAGTRTPAVTSAFARREHSYRARRAAGSAEVDDQAQNVRWRNRTCCHRAAMRIITGRGGQKPPRKDGAGAGLPAERSCPPGTDRLAPGLDLANLDQITPAARGSRCMPAAIGCTRGCDGPRGAGRRCRSPPASYGSSADLGDRPWRSPPSPAAGQRDPFPDVGG
jgi:hypothetical protein